MFEAPHGQRRSAPPRAVRARLSAAPISLGEAPPLADAGATARGIRERGWHEGRAPVHASRGSAAVPLGPEGAVIASESSRLARRARRFWATSSVRPIAGMLTRWVICAYK
jgi:hypothetical protein